MQSRDCTTIVCNLEIGMQFPDSENAQHNLKIAQIPRLCGTEIFPLKTCNSSPDMVGYYMCIPAIAVFTGTGSLSVLPAPFTAVTVMK